MYYDKKSDAKTNENNFKNYFEKLKKKIEYK